MKRKMLKSSSNSNSSSGHDQQMFIYELPLSVRENLCHHLDELKVWNQLAKFMSLTPGEIQTIRTQELKGNSPTNEILNIWGGQYNHEVVELFAVLHKHKLHQAMRILKDYVNKKYHYLIPVSQPLLSDLLPANNNIEDVSRKLLNCSITSSSGVSNSNNVDESSLSPQGVTNGANTESSISFNEKNIQKYASCMLEINYSELCEATNNWSESNILGKGGFGTVYKGFWKETHVAIKLMHYKTPNGNEDLKVQIQQSLNELKFLNSCRHDNILPLYGYSIKGEKPCLLYQLMLGGSLDERLIAKNYEPLTWKQRINICYGTARGINYLHTFREKPLIHGDIKPANILLDSCLTPKIGDFGLAREGPNAINTAVEVSHVFGTKVYLPPEFLRSKKLSTKVDTFSFGIVVLETFTGQRAYNKQRVHYIQKFICTPGRHIGELIEQKVPFANGEQDMCKQMLNIGLACTSDNSDQRPEMVQVLQAIREQCNRFQIFLS